MKTIKNLVNINMVAVGLLFVSGLIGANMDEGLIILMGLVMVTCAIWLTVLVNKQ